MNTFISHSFIPFHKPDISEDDIRAVTSTLRSGWLTSGPQVYNFEQALRQYCQCGPVMVLNSATSALTLLLMTLEIGHGDEVICPAYGFCSVPAVISFLGAKPIFADSLPHTFNLDPLDIEKKITKATKAVIMVDFAGNLADYSTTLEVLQNQSSMFLSGNKPIQNILGRCFLIADAAHSFGASVQGIKSGAIADFSIFSFHAVKNLTSGEGGALCFSKNLIHPEFKQQEQRIRRLASHGLSKSGFERSSSRQWEYHVVEPGFKMNMTDIQASLGLSQLKRQNQLLTSRKNIASLYKELLKNSPLDLEPHNPTNKIHAHHLFPTLIHGASEELRNSIIQQMMELGIACNVHYKPIPMHPAWQSQEFIRECPQAIKHYQREITLPLYASLRFDEIMHVASTFTKILKSTLNKSRRNSHVIG